MPRDRQESEVCGQSAQKDWAGRQPLRFTEYLRPDDGRMNSYDISVAGPPDHGGTFTDFEEPAP